MTIPKGQNWPRVKTSFKEDAFENAIWKLAQILFRSQCVFTLRWRSNWCHLTNYIIKFTRMQFCVSLFKFHWNLSKMPNQKQASSGSHNGLVVNWWQAIIWTNDGLVYCHIYASLSLGDLIPIQQLLIEQHPWIDIIALSSPAFTSPGNPYNFLLFVTQWSRVISLERTRGAFQIWSQTIKFKSSCNSTFA